MYQFYHGDDLPREVNVLGISHAQQLEDYCNGIVRQCAKYWLDLIPKLVEHYSCCYTCSVGRLCFPRFCFGGYYRWVVKYPTACYYRYYYKCYRWEMKPSCRVLVYTFFSQQEEWFLLKLLSCRCRVFMVLVGWKRSSFRFQWYFAASNYSLAKHDLISFGLVLLLYCKSPVFKLSIIQVILCFQALLLLPHQIRQGMLLLQLRWLLMPCCGACHKFVSQCNCNDTSKK